MLVDRGDFLLLAERGDFLLLVDRGGFLLLADRGDFLFCDGGPSPSGELEGGHVLFVLGRCLFVVVSEPVFELSRLF